MCTEVLDHTLCQEMAKYVEELTTSGRPALNPDIMKSFKKICRVSNLYCEQAYHLLITQLEKGHSEIRLSSFQMIEELFNRSHCFRELLISNFQHFLELTVETDYDCPLPPPKTAAELLKSSAYSAIQKWYDKFGEEYKRLALGFNFLKSCKKVDFNGIRARSELQQRQEKEIEEKRKKIAEERIEKTLQQMNELMNEIKSAIIETKTGFELVLPSPDEFFIDMAEDMNKPKSVKDSENKTSCAIKKEHFENTSEENRNQIELTSDLNMGCGTNDHENNSTSCSNDSNKSDDNNPANQDDSLPRKERDMNSVNDTKCSPSLKIGDELNKGEENKINLKSEIDSKFCSSDQNVQITSSHHDENETQNICNRLNKGGNLTNVIKGDNIKNVIKGDNLENVTKGDNLENSNSNQDKTYCDNTNTSCSQLNVTASEDEIDSDEESESDDEDAPEETENMLQEHGLGNIKYNLSIDVTPGVVSLQETEDNKDIIQTLKDQYRLIVTKYKPTVNKWIQTLTKYGDNEDTTKSVIDVKTELDSLLSKYHEMNIIPEEKPSQEDDDDESDDDFEDVPEKEGYEPVIPPHKRAEYGLEPLQPSLPAKSFTQRQKPSTSSRTSGFWSLSKTIAQKPEDDPTTMKANFARLPQISVSSGTKVDNSFKPLVTSSGDPEKDKLLQKAPVVPYGTDLEHWENQDKMETPLVIKYETNRVWAHSEVDESQPDKDSLAALKNRTISFVGKFEPVKWKCRAPMPNGKFCDRMDRFKCPFHGKIIARNDLGQPTDPKDIAALSRHDDIDITSKDQSYWRDPELEADIEAALGIDLGSGKGKSKGKGKGKGKGKQKKYPNLTDIKEVKNTSRNRLEKKIFKKSAMKRVAADMDALANKKARDKFGNQFVYQISNR